MRANAVRFRGIAQTASLLNFLSLVVDPRKVLPVRKKFHFWFFALLLTAAVSSSSLVAGQTRRSARVATPNLLNSLPPSDAVATVKLRRVLDEALPKLLASNPSRLAEANAQVEQFKTKTGLDPRTFEEVAFGIRFLFPSEGVTKFDTVALARGTFSPGALVAAGRIAANGKYQEQQHQGKTIYIFTLDQQIRLFGLLNARLGELAVSPLDANTLALGDLESVRGVIDLKRGRTRANADLIALATRNPDALAGFGGNVSAELRRNLAYVNDTIARDLTAVRQVYGSVGLTEKDLELNMAARTVDEYSARNLGNTIEALKQFGALFVGRLSPSKAALARSALNGLKITSLGNELQIKATVAQTDLAPVMGGL